MDGTVFDRSGLLGQQKDDRSDRFLNVLLTVVIIFLCFVFFVKFVWFEPVLVDGSSMNKTISDGDVLIMDKLSSYEYGDIVILKIDDKTNYVKRIVGLPGDTIRNDAEGKVYRISPDGAETLLDEPYAYFDPLFGNGTFLNETGRFSVTLADDEIFVMGDNRYHSKDSRSIGPLKQSSVLGVVHPWVVEYRYKLGWLYYYL